MQRLKKDQALADLPAPVALTPDQLMAVAAGTAAILKGTQSGILGTVVISGAFPTPPIPVVLTHV
jgi:hypothetical protein